MPSLSFFLDGDLHLHVLFVIFLNVLLKSFFVISLELVKSFLHLFVFRFVLEQREFSLLSSFDPSKAEVGHSSGEVLLDVLPLLFVVSMLVLVESS